MGTHHPQALSLKGLVGLPRALVPSLSTAECFGAGTRAKVTLGEPWVTVGCGDGSQSPPAMGQPLGLVGFWEGGAGRGRVGREVTLEK